MRIIFLNAWYAKAGQVFYDFISEKSSSVDIICLSEVYPEMFSKLAGILPDFDGFYEQGSFDWNMNLVYGQAIFYKRELKVENLGRINFYGKGPNKFAFALPFTINHGKNAFYVVNVHGSSRPGSKLDTAIRLRQSQLITEFLKDKKLPKIIGGDFNLLPETKSIKIIESAGYKNLIKEFNIKSTRNRIAWEQFSDDVKKNGKQYYADFCFVSPEIKVKNFEVPPVEISDHLPLILDFEV